MDNVPAPLYGLVLAGGKSSRMGTDKFQLRYHQLTQGEHVFGLLQGVCEKVYTSRKEGQEVAASLNPLLDAYGFQSPLNGVLSAFALHPDKAWLCVAVDMPGVGTSVLRHLVGNRDCNVTATCYMAPEGHWPEPLLTIWEPRVYPMLLDFYRAGNISPRDFLKTASLRLLALPDESALSNINTVEEWKAYIKDKGDSESGL